MACNDWIVCCCFFLASRHYTPLFFSCVELDPSFLTFFWAMKQTNTCFSRFFVLAFLKKESEKMQGKNELTFSFWFQTVSAVILLLSTRHVTRRTRRLGDNNKRSRWRFVILFIYLQYFLFPTATFPRSCSSVVSSVCRPSVCMYVWAFCLFVTGLFSLFYVGSLPSPATVHLTLVTHASTLRVVALSDGTYSAGQIHTAAKKRHQGNTAERGDFFI